MLRDDQVASVARIHAAFEEFGGALLADPPGTGKTVTALAVASAFADVLVVLPATLRPQWTRAAARAGVQLRSISFEALSRSARPARADLVIVDEAHHGRTPMTARYRALASLCVGARVLLLTATPVVNRQSDLQALLALFLGTRAAALTAPEAARLILRHRPDDGLRPCVVTGPALEGAADVPGLGAALAQLPPALPAEDGAPAVALTRISLAFAWCSSLAALDAALRRRLHRGAALQQGLAAGRWLSRNALRSWAISDDSMQLSLVELVAPPGDRSIDLRAARDVLESHLAAVRELRALVRPHIPRDTAARAAAIRAIMDPRSGERTVVFARHAGTIRALWREFRSEGGTLALTGVRVEAAAGRWSRNEVLRALGATTAPHSASDPRAIRLLLTTDLLAEGVEMPSVRTLVHADLAWTPARIEQRTGRITRAASGGGEVREFRFAAPPGAVPLVRLAERLHRKREARDDALRVAREVDALHALFADWAVIDEREPLGGARIAAVQAELSGFIAVLGSHGSLGAQRRTTSRLCGWRRDGAWRTSTTSRALLGIVRAAQGAPLAVSTKTVREVRSVIARALRDAEAIARLGGIRAGSPAESAGAVRASSLARRLSIRFEFLIRRAPYLERIGLATVDRELRLALKRGMGVASEAALLTALDADGGSGEFIAQVRQILASISRTALPAPDDPPLAADRAPTIEALLILIPPETARLEGRPPALS